MIIYILNWEQTMSIDGVDHLVSLSYLIFIKDLIWDHYYLTFINKGYSRMLYKLKILLFNVRGLTLILEENHVLYTSHI